MSRYVIRIVRQAGFVVMFLVAAVLGSISGVLFAFASDIPQISALDDYAPSTITRVYAANGDVVGEFATERRVVIGYDQISPWIRKAVVAGEDDEFDRHFGVSLPRLVVTAIKDIVYQRRYGASTLSQQLARKLFLSDEKTWERKIKELILTIQIEKRYTKQEIFTLYCNQIPLGHGAYGMEAAARLYFNKSAKDVTVEEAALLAGIIQRPADQSPYVDMNAAMRRRNYVLQRMAEVGYISQSDAETAKKRPIVVKGRPTQESIAPYFLEDVRKYLEAKYGAKQLYESGLSVYTSLDVKLQAAANRAVDGGLRQLDKRRGFRRPTRNVFNEGHSVESFRHDRWKRAINEGDIVPAVVAGVEGGRIQVRAGQIRAEIAKEGFAWARKPPAQILKAGDLIDVRIVKIDPQKGTAAAWLEQAPIVEGALLAIDNKTGQVKAMVGGYSFVRSKFNRATQAMRQVGSAFKPFVYTAAIDRGYTPATILSDTPVSYSAGPGQPPYMPHDYDGKYEGPITLRHALEQSRNVPAVRTMDQLGPKQVVAYARRFGLTSPMEPYLSLALGAAESTLIEMTSAYSVFPNQGVRMRPYPILRISDREGNLLEENRPEPADAIRADTAFVMTNLLRGVVQRGTAAQAASLNWPLAGKTGTTDDYTDAWFIGFDPDITVGVWTGFDEKKPLGSAETGSRAALPIWIDFMKAYIALRGRENVPQFQPPGNIVFLAVDRATGAPLDTEDPGAIHEAFISGTQPTSGIPKQ
jgi:penicillin-binding protein 1A